MSRAFSFVLATALAAAATASATELPKDVIPTAADPIEITFVGHGSLVFTIGARVVHVDPYSRLADYAALPKADAILVTHSHGDHLDAKAIAAIRKPDTALVVSPACLGKLEGASVLENGKSTTVAGIEVLAVPAYNLVHKRDDGGVFHPPGEGNGYVLTYGGVRIYVAGDTENTPEMKALTKIDVAFLPMNLPYTMTPEMVADAARAFRPRILYPYHYGETDTNRLVELLRDEKGIDLRLRPLK